MRKEQIQMQDMKVKDVQALFPEDIMYRIPIYQRHYIWGDINWKHLWEDIKEQAENPNAKPHFTGVIVTRKRQNSDNVLDIVDGQQRLTTLQIVLCAIRDICSSVQKCQDIKNDVEACITTTGTESQDDMYKLLPLAEANRKVFASLVNRKLNGIDGPIFDAYIFFERKIRNYVAGNAGKMLNLFNGILKGIFVVEIQLDSRDNGASQIFEGINGRGIALIQLDHLRNNIFLRASDKAHDLYNKYWKHLNEEEYWLKNKNADSFLRDFLKANIGPKFTTSLTLFDLYNREYRKVLQDNGPTEEHAVVEHEFIELEKYSKVYAEIANCSHPAEPIWLYKFLATEYGITSWHPLVLLLKSKKDDLGISDDELSLTFRVLESYIVRCALCHGAKVFAFRFRFLN